MALISFDYGELNEASKIAKSVSGYFGAYSDYRNDLQRDLYSSLEEWKLAASEPNGCTSVSDARSNITTKRSQLETSSTEWKNLSSNIITFRKSVEEKDKNAAKAFKDTSKAYTNYHGIGGAFRWIGDTFYNIFAVDLANSNKVTRAIADWGKRKLDDLSIIKQDIKDYFQHGNGRYILNIAGSVLFTGAAIVGTVIAFATIPFSGGSTAVIAVSLIGAVAGGVSSIISAFNTYHTCRENVDAFKLHDSDPGAARFHGDVTSYSDHVSKTKYSSPEEYKKHANIAHGIDVIDTACTVVSVTASAATTFGTKTVQVRKGSNVENVTKFDFSPKNVKSNVLKTFGFKTTSETVKSDVVRQEQAVINHGGEAGDTVIDMASSSDEFNAAHKSTEATKKTVDATAHSKEIKYTQRVKTTEKITVKSEYNALAASNGQTTRGYAEYAEHAKYTKKTVDYSNAVMSKSKVDKIKFAESIKDAKTQKDIDKLVRVRNLNRVKSGMESLGNVTKSLRGERTGFDTVKDFAKKNTFINSFDKYVYSIPTSEDAEGKDYVKGIGGSNSSKYQKFWETVTDKAS